MFMGFVYKGVLVLFEEGYGYFLYIGEKEFKFPSKESIKEFINSKLN